MTNLFQMYETDPQRERDGVEVAIKDPRGQPTGAVVILRRAGGGNRRYIYALGRAMDPHREIFANLDAPENQQAAEDLETEVTQEAYADAVILGWRNVHGRDGELLPFSRAAFLDLVRSCPNVWDQLRLAALDMDRFRGNGHLKEDGEHLGKSFSGGSSGANV